MNSPHAIHTHNAYHPFHIPPFVLDFGRIGYTEKPNVTSLSSNKCSAHTAVHNYHQIYLRKKIFLTFAGSNIYLFVSFTASRTEPELKMDDISVEVCGENGAYYKVCMPKSM